MPYLSSLISKSLTEMNPVPHRYDLFDMPVLSIIQRIILGGRVFLGDVVPYPQIIIFRGGMNAFRTASFPVSGLKSVEHSARCVRLEHIVRTNRIYLPIDRDQKDKPATFCCTRSQPLPTCCEGLYQDACGGGKQVCMVLWARVF